MRPALKRSLAEMQLRIIRKVVEAEVSRLIDLLDALDADPDMEPDTDNEDSHDAEGVDDDSEPTSDAEPDDGCTYYEAAE